MTSQALHSAQLPAHTNPPPLQATIYYDETEEREEGADLEELIRDGQIAFSERCAGLCCAAVLRCALPGVPAAQHALLLRRVAVMACPACRCRV